MLHRFVQLSEEPLPQNAAADVDAAFQALQKMSRQRNFLVVSNMKMKINSFGSIYEASDI